MRTFNTLFFFLGLLSLSSLVTAEQDETSSLSKLLSRITNSRLFRRTPIKESPVACDLDMSKRSAVLARAEAELLEVEKRESNRMVRMRRGHGEIGHGGHGEARNARRQASIVGPTYSHTTASPITSVDPNNPPWGLNPPNDYDSFTLAPYGPSSSIWVQIYPVTYPHDSGYQPRTTPARATFGDPTTTPTATTAQAPFNGVTPTPTPTTVPSTESIPPWGLSDPDTEHTYTLVPFGPSSSIWEEVFPTSTEEPVLSNPDNTPPPYDPYTTTGTPTSTYEASIPPWGTDPSNGDATYTLVPFGPSSSLWVEIYPHSTGSPNYPGTTTPAPHNYGSPTPAPTAKPTSLNSTQKSSALADRRQNHAQVIAAAKKKLAQAEAKQLQAEKDWQAAVQAVSSAASALAALATAGVA